MNLTDNEVRVLKTILRVDMDALGLAKRDQTVVRAIYKKILQREVANRARPLLKKTLNREVANRAAHEIGE